MLHFSKRLPIVAASALASTSLYGVNTAQAHVKWFAPYDVSSQPRVLERVFTPDLAALILLSVSILVFGYLLNRTVLGEQLSRALDRVTGPVRSNGRVLLRAVCAFFLISVWTVGGTILTPELKTTASWVPLLQLFMAASLLSRRSALFAAFGIVVLYADAVASYGLFHLLDYPIFLAVAAFLAADALGTWKKPFIVLRFDLIDILRYGAAITLMWASIEKWAYPEWTLPIYLQHPELTMGYDFELFMQAAGVIEFTLAFALLGPSLVRRSAAFILLGMFVSATFGFGKVDVIGHAVIVAVLLMLGADSRRNPVRANVWRGIAVPSLGFATAFVVFMTLYYGIHALMFRTAII